MSNQRKEFEKWVDENGSRCDDRDDAYRLWSAAQSASDARYQGRIKELEEALRTVGRINYDAARVRISAIVEEALSITTPDTAYQKALLEARIDELETARDSTHLERRSELRAQLAALESNETLGE